MDFQRISPLNFRLNLLSGNLLPMTDNSSYSIFWRIYSAIVWLIELINTVTLIPACFLLSKEIVFNNGIILCLVVTLEAGFMVMRINSQTTLVQQLIRKLNQILMVEDENMRNIVITNVKPLDTPFKFYLVFGTFSLLIWCCPSLLLALDKNIFYYEDFSIPGIYSKEPFSVDIFLLGTVIIIVSNVYIFLKKVSVDVYTTHLIALVTAQYQYIASRLVLLFRKSNQLDSSSFLENNFKVDFSIEKEMKSLCRHHNNVIHYSIAAMFVKSQISSSFLEGCTVMVYGSGSVMQFYILCSCFQNLSDASSEITDKAFHEDWYRFSSSIKRTFLLVITANNYIDLRLSVFERFNLSLPSFMTIINQSYSFALLILRMK